MFGNDELQVLDAMDKDRAQIEFTLDGTIVDATANFVGAMGYGPQWRTGESCQTC